MPINWSAAGVVVAGFAVIVAILALRRNTSRDTAEAARWRGRVDQFMKAVEADVKELRRDIKGILARLPVQEIMVSSPLRLTDFGKALSDGIAGAEWASRIAEEVALDVAGM